MLVSSALPVFEEKQTHAKACHEEGGVRTEAHSIDGSPASAYVNKNTMSDYFRCISPPKDR